MHASSKRLPHIIRDAHFRLPADRAPEVMQEHQTREWNIFLSYDFRYCIAALYDSPLLVIINVRTLLLTLLALILIPLSLRGAATVGSILAVFVS